MTDQESSQQYWPIDITMGMGVLNDPATPVDVFSDGFRAAYVAEEVKIADELAASAFAAQQDRMQREWQAKMKGLEPHPAEDTVAKAAEAMARAERKEAKAQGVVTVADSAYDSKTPGGLPITSKVAVEKRKKERLELEAATPASVADVKAVEKKSNAGWAKLAGKIHGLTH